MLISFKVKNFIGNEEVPRVYTDCIDKIALRITTNVNFNQNEREPIKSTKE